MTDEQHNSRQRRKLRALSAAFIAACVLAEATLYAAGTSWNPPAQPEQIPDWFTSSTDLVILGIVRLVALGVVAYLALAGVALFIGIGQTERPRRAVAANPRLGRFALLLAKVAGAGTLAVPAGLTTTAPAFAQDQSSTPTEPAPEDASPSEEPDIVVMRPLTGDEEDEFAVMVELLRDGDQTGSSPLPSIRTQPDPVPADPIEIEPILEAGRWEVQPGESLWTIAEDQLLERSGTIPTNADIAPYWLELIEQNRSVLPMPENPGLIHPGLVLDLPEITG